MIEPVIVEKQPFRVVGMQRPFIHVLSPDTNAGQEIGGLWADFGKCMKSLPGRVGEISYGVILGEDEERRVHPDELQYIAAVEVEADAAPPEGMICWTVPGGTFASVLHRGPIEKIGETCHAIYREWLPQSSWEHSGLVDVEVYDDRFCDGDRSVMEYRVSVKPRSR